MIVKSILSAKGRDVATIAPTATLAEATKILAERKIGALVVTGAGGRITGIVSERDMVRAFAQHGAAAFALPLTDVMTRKVVTCSIDRHGFDIDGAYDRRKVQASAGDR